MNTLRKIFASALVLGMAFSYLAVTTPAHAAAAGTNIKMAGLSTVYYLGADNKRYVYPNDRTYKSWYVDFSNVQTVSQSELESYSLGANVTMRPGTWLVKITTNPNVYAVEPGGKLRSIVSESNAISLWGANWASKVVDVADGFFTNYTVQGPLTAGMYSAGSLVKMSNSADVYYFDGTSYRKFASEAAFIGNRFRFDFVATAPNTMTFTPAGTMITGPESSLIDTSSGAGGSITGSGLSVALASDTPASATVPSNATGVKMAKFNFTAANDGDVILSDLTIKRTGVGATTELSKLYLYDGATRLTSGRTISASSNEAVFSNVGVTITKGTTRSLTVVADIANASSGSHALQIESAAKVVASGATVSGSFPSTGNTMSLSTTSAGKIDVDSNGTDYTRKVGETNVEIGNFSVYANNTEDAWFKGITLYNSGRDVINNVKIYRGSDLVGTATKSGTNFVVTLTNPIEVLKGNSVSFVVKGDVSGRDGDTATLYVRYKTDVMTTGKTYGFGLGFDGTLGSANSYVEEVDSSPLNNVTTVDAGQLTAAFNGPSAGSVSKNTNDIVLMNFSLTPQAAVEISKMTVYIGGANLIAADIDNLEVKINGSTVASTAAVLADDDNDISTGTVGHNTFTDTFTLPAGQTAAGQIIIDINNSATGNETIKAALMSLTNTTYWTIKTTDGDTVTDIVPSGNIAGNLMSVIAASLAVNLGSNPANGSSYVKGSTNVPVVGYAFTAGTAVDVKVTSIMLTAYTADDGNINAGATEINQASGAADVMVAVGLYVDDVLIAPKKSLTVNASTITVTFDSLNWVIPKSVTKSIVAKADISTTAPLSATDDEIALTIAVLGDVTAEYGSGTNLAATLPTTNTTTPSIAQLVTAGGTIAMALDASSPLASLVTSGTQNVTYTKAKLTTTKEAYRVTKLRLTNSANDSNFTSLMIAYKNEAGADVTATAPLVGGTANFTFPAGSEVYLAKDADTSITVKANMNTTIGGAANGAGSTITVESDAGFEAYGVSSGEQKTTTTGSDAVGKTMTVYESKPSFAFDNTGISTLPSGSTSQLVAKLVVTADAGKDITFNTATGGEVTFALNVINPVVIGGDDDVVTLKDDNGTTLDTDTLDFASGAQTVVFDFSTTNLTVAAGTSETIFVYADTSELLAGGDMLQFWLDDGAASNVEWSINNVGVFEHADILFRNDLFGPVMYTPV